MEELLEWLPLMMYITRQPQQVPLSVLVAGHLAGDDCLAEVGSEGGEGLQTCIHDLHDAVGV